jgi:hypothetical protein
MDSFYESLQKNTDNVAYSQICSNYNIKSIFSLSNCATFDTFISKSLSLVYSLLFRHH